MRLLEYLISNHDDAIMAIQPLFIEYIRDIHAVDPTIQHRTIQMERDYKYEAVIDIHGSINVFLYDDIGACTQVARVASANPRD